MRGQGSLQGRGRAHTLDHGRPRDRDGHVDHVRLSGIPAIELCEQIIATARSPPRATTHLDGVQEALDTKVEEGQRRWHFAALDGR